MATLLGENPTLRHKAEAWLEALEKKTPSSANTRELRLAMRHTLVILSQPWGQPSGHTSLLQACVAALKAEKSAKPVFGTLEANPYWMRVLLNDLADTDLGPDGSETQVQVHQVSDMALWREAFDLAVAQAVTSSTNDNLQDFFRKAWAVEGLLAESTLVSFLEVPSDRFFKLAAGICVRPRERERLAELAMSLKPHQQVNALKLLSNRANPPSKMSVVTKNGTSYVVVQTYPPTPEWIKNNKPTFGPLERKLWNHVFQSQPLEASARFTINDNSEFVDYPLAQDSVRAFWEREAESKALANEDFSTTPLTDLLYPSLKFLLRKHDSRNAPILRSLLTYRGYHISDRGTDEKQDENDPMVTPWEQRVFGIRTQAAEFLKQLGETVPDTLVFEKKVTLPPVPDGWPHAFSGGVVEWPSPNVELPPQVVAEVGKLTLFADYEHPEKEGVPLYLVNRAREAIMLPSMSGSLNIQLERQLPSGAWERAQERWFSFCGNSYGVRNLPPGMFFQFHGYQPRKELGQPSPIRFMRYDQVPMMSNIGAGFFAPQDVERAKRDDLSLRDVPSSIHRQFIRVDAGLAPSLDLSGRLACLRMAELVGEHPVLREKAEKWLGQLEELPDPTAEENQAIALAKSILGRDWGEPKGLERLMKACLDSLNAGGEAAKDFGSLARESKLVWTVVGEIAEIDQSPPLFGSEAHSLPRKLWSDTLNLAMEKLVTSNPTERMEISRVFQRTSLVDETLPSDAFERLLQVDDPQVATLAAEVLVRRGQTEKLAELGMILPGSRRIAVLVSLAEQVRSYSEMTLEMHIGGGLRNPGPRELELWGETVKTQAPLLAAEICTRGKIVPDKEMENLTNQIRAYWQAELKLRENSDRDFELTTEEARLTSSLNFLARSRLPQDFDLMRSLFGHRGYMKHESFRNSSDAKKSEKLEIHSYLVRRAASSALKQYDQTVPNGIVYEVEVKPDGSPL